MPSVEHQKAKQATIDEIKDKLNKASSAVVIDYIGTTVAEADAMRKKLRESDIDYKVYKNTLLTRAIDGTDYSPLGEVLAGPTALAISYEDATAPARILNGIFKEYKKMSFKAGIVDGVYYDADGIKEIAEIPSREVLLSRLLGSMKSPLSKFVRTLAAIAEEQGGGENPAAEAVEAVAEAAAGEAAPAEVPAEEAPAEEVATEVEVSAEAPVEEAAPTEEAVAEEAPVAVTEAPAEEAAPEAEAPEEAITEESAEAPTNVE